ncbi:MAG: hypothetical protein AB1742_06140 [bacterium]
MFEIRLIFNFIPERPAGATRAAASAKNIETERFFEREKRRETIGEGFCSGIKFMHKSTPARVKINSNMVSGSTFDRV